MVSQCWATLLNWIKSGRKQLTAPPTLTWTRTSNGVLYAEHGECTFEIAATEEGFLLIAHGEAAGILRVDAETEREAQTNAAHLLRCWPRWTVTAAPVVDS